MSWYRLYFSCHLNAATGSVLHTFDSLSTQQEYKLIRCPNNSVLDRICSSSLFLCCTSHPFSFILQEDIPGTSPMILDLTTFPLQMLRAMHFLPFIEFSRRDSLPVFILLGNRAASNKIMLGYKYTKPNVSIMTPFISIITGWGNSMPKRGAGVEIYEA